MFGKINQKEYEEYIERSKNASCNSPENELYKHLKEKGRSWNEMKGQMAHNHFYFQNPFEEQKP